MLLINQSSFRQFGSWKLRTSTKIIRKNEAHLIRQWKYAILHHRTTYEHQKGILQSNFVSGHSKPKCWLQWTESLFRWLTGNQIILETNDNVIGANQMHVFIDIKNLLRNLGQQKIDFPRVIKKIVILKKNLLRLDSNLVLYIP